MKIILKREVLMITRVIGSAFQFMLMMGMVMLLITVATAPPATRQAKPDCPDHCGDVGIPYPFGTRPGCYLNEQFLITCNNSINGTKALLRKSNISVRRITIDGQLHIQNYVARDCFKNGGTSEDQNKPWLSLAKFTISNTKNMFTVIGCDSYAYIQGYIENQSYSSGCMSLCDSSNYVKDGSCIGTGCCQIEIPRGLRKINVTAYSFHNHKNVSKFNPCTYAFVVEKSEFKFNSSYLASLPESFPIVLDWEINGGTNCREARSKPDYACKENAVCYEPDNRSGSGYLCKCKKGYRGNPYLSHGCRDIDECKESLQNCTHKCINEEGSYRCECPKGNYKVGRKGEENCVPIRSHFSEIKVILVGGICFVVLLLSVTWLYLMWKRRKLIKLREKFFQQNGGFILQEQLAKRTGSSDTAKVFTADELKKATNNFAVDRIIGRGGYGTVYKGFLADNNPVAIKKSKVMDKSRIEQFINEVVVLLQINHRNVVRLLGCCLETEVPLLVYEFVSNGTLYEHIHKIDKASAIPWETRLKIAAETAEVLSYLHFAASTPIIHRDVKSSNILLDDNFTAKVSDFGASKLVPMDITQLSTMVQGTLGYLDPEYFFSSKLTEKSDVYSFGVVLVELLTGKKPILLDRPEEERSLVMYFLSLFEEGCLFEIVESHMVNDGSKDQLIAVAELASRCLRVKGVERPTMREVALELERLTKMLNKNLQEKNVTGAIKCDDSSDKAAYDSINEQVAVAMFDDGR